MRARGAVESSVSRRISGRWISGREMACRGTSGGGATDTGQAVPLLAGVLAVVASLLIGLVALGNLVGARARAQSAADAAALAGAARGRPAAVAMAAENHGELESFGARDGEVEVTVRVGDARATSRARRQW